MSATHTSHVTMPCPSCHVRQPLTAAFRSGAWDGAEAVLHECPRCWSARARALNDARADLRLSGDLARAGSRLTWMGEVVGPERETDGLEGALLSALLRRDLPATGWVRLEIPATVPSEVTTAPQAHRS